MNKKILNHYSYIYSSLSFFIVLLVTSCHIPKPGTYLIETESFAEYGGWVLDNQSMMQMGSPYLLAHGLGVPVADATTTFRVKETGTYRLWVRTRDWVKRWGKEGAPGKFQVLLNGEPLDTVFGTKTAEWDWQDGGLVSLEKGDHQLALHDLTGFDGRCDALYLTLDTAASAPTNEKEALASLRDSYQSSVTPQKAGNFDLVVVGGGIAGCCTAITAARLGCKVALIQNRPILGGNNSSEVRVGLSGRVNQQPYPHLGDLMDELGGVGFWNNVEAQENPNDARSRQILTILQDHPEKHIHNAGPASNYEDEKKRSLVCAEKNISLYLNMQVNEVVMGKGGSRIKRITAQDIRTGERTVFEGALFADCTGDATLGFLSGADYRMGRESKAETGELRAPEKADSLTMGTSVQWYSTEQETDSPFPECPWAITFDEQTCVPLLRGEWDWEVGLNDNQIEEIEYIRDYALRAIYGNWAYLKNHYSGCMSYERQQLEWVAYIGGKRESRRLMGDVVLKEQDLLQAVPYPDATFTTTWGVDLHYPKQVEGMKEEPFQSYCEAPSIQPYAVPYRCLYSRNVENLFMAGRNISVTHIALGTVRVMRTCGMMGEVVGMAASLCREHQAMPRDIYTDYFPELRTLMEKGVGKRGFSE